MRIYRVNVERKCSGYWNLNWKRFDIAARNAEEAIRKAKRDFNTLERIESVELLASAD